MNTVHFFNDSISISNSSIFVFFLPKLYQKEQEMEKQKLLFHQARLSNRGVAEMVLLHISASKGVPSEMVMTTLGLGIAILRGGNIDIQMGMLNHLKEKKDVGFFTSIAGLMNSCSVLDLDAFERNTKAEGTIMFR